jgi:protein-disulfide isomerase
MAATLFRRPGDGHSSRGVSAGVLIAPVPDSGSDAAKRPSGLAVVLAFGGAIAVALALVIAAVVFRDSSDNVEPPPGPAVDFTGIQQDGATLGDPAAAVTFIEYADLQCPACRQYALGLFPGIVDDYVRPGRVKAEFRGLPFLGEDSFKAQRFVSAAGLQDRLWNLQEALYRNQGTENSGWVTDELVRELAAGIDGLDVDRLFVDAESDEIARAVEDGVAQAEAAGVAGTPTFFIQVGSDEPYALESGLTAAQLRAALEDALGR